MAKNKHQYQTLFFEKTSSALTRQEESNDIENDHVTQSVEKDELSQNSKMCQATINLSTAEDKTMKISDKNECIQQPPYIVNFTQKTKEHYIRNGKNEFLIKWQNYPRSETT